MDAGEFPTELAAAGRQDRAREDLDLGRSGARPAADCLEELAAVNALRRWRQQRDGFNASTIVDAISAGGACHHARVSRRERADSVGLAGEHAGAHFGTAQKAREREHQNSVRRVKRLRRNSACPFELRPPRPKP
jgi:hypothetical protein